MMSARRQTGRESSPRARSAHHRQQSSEDKGRGLVCCGVALGRNVRCASYRYSSYNYGVRGEDSATGIEC